jgi:hypothetical protein
VPPFLPGHRSRLPSSRGTTSRPWARNGGRRHPLPPPARRQRIPPGAQHMYPAGAAANSRQHGTTRARRSGPSFDPDATHARRGVQRRATTAPRPRFPAKRPPQPRGARVGTRWRMRIWPRPAACALAYGTGLAPSLTSFMRDGGEDLQAVGVRRSGLPCRAARGLAMASRGQVTGKGMSWVLRRTYFPNGRNGAESSTPSMTGGARPRGRPTRLRDRREDRLRRSTAPDAGTNAARASCAFGGRAWIAPKPVDGLPSFVP